jgi:chorismate mutase
MGTVAAGFFVVPKSGHEYEEKGPKAMTIEYWRTEIDEIDRELLRLLNRRARLALKVGQLKRAAGLPCCDPDRERVVLSTLRQANTGPLDSRAVTKLFRRIIGESRRVETQVPAAEEGESGRGKGERSGIRTEPGDTQSASATQHAQRTRSTGAREALL